MKVCVLLDSNNIMVGVELISKALVFIVTSWTGSSVVIAHILPNILL